MPGIYIGNYINRSLRSSWTPQLYVSNSGSGTGSGTITDPLTPDQLAASTLVKGQTLLFNKGEVYDSFTLNVPVDDITIDSYGTGAAPILSGSSVIATGEWTSEGSGVYSVAKAGAKWLYFNDSISENAKTTYLQCASRPAANIIRVSSANKTYLNTFANLVGLQLRSFDNGAFRLTYAYTITGYDSGTGDITVDRDMLGSTGVNYFFIYNYAGFLANEKWSWDGTTLKFKTALTIADHVIRLGTIDVGINVTGNNCTIQNITLKHYQKKAINCYNKTINVLDCTIRDMRGNAVYVYGNSAIPNIQRNTIYNVGNNGVQCGGVASGNILNNTIYNIGVGVDIGWPVTDAFASVDGYPYISRFGTTDDTIMYTGRGIGSYQDFTLDYFLSDSLVIRYNTIYNVAGDGIIVSGDNHNIDYNTVYNFAQIYDDVAGIHTGANDPAYLRDASCKDLTINKNIIYTPRKLSAWSILSSLRAVGIYPDEGAKDHVIDGNLIYSEVIAAGLANTPSGTEGIFFWTVNTGHEVKNNIIANYGTASLGGYDSATIKGLKVHHNVFYSVGIDLLRVYASYYTEGGYFNNNTYISPSRGTVLKLNTTRYNLADWRTTTGQDADSTVQTEYRVIIPSSDYLVYSNPTTSAAVVDITAGYKDLAGDDISSATLQPYESILVLKKYVGSLLFADNFNGAVIDVTKWAETDPDGRIAQDEWLTLTNPHNKTVLEWVNYLLGQTSIASGVAVASGYLAWTPTTVNEAMGGIYLYKDASNFASITSRATNGNFRLRIYTGGVSRYDVFAGTPTQGKNVKIWTDGTYIKFYYWDTVTSAWIQMGTTQTFSLGYPLIYAITALDASGVTGAYGIYLENISLVATEYTTRFPV